MEKIQNIALSVHPEFVKKIFNREKNVEYRTRRTNKRGKIFIYETKNKGGSGAIVGWVEILDCLWSEKNDRYEYKLGNRELYKTPIKPARKPNVIFKPFNRED